MAENSDREQRTPNMQEEAAYVSTRYLLGARGQELTFGLQAPLASTQELSGRLAHAERAVRANVLAGELAQVMLALKRLEHGD